MPIITEIHLRLKLVQIFNFLLIFIFISSQSQAITDKSNLSSVSKIEVKDFHNYKILSYNKKILLIDKKRPLIAYKNNLTNTYQYLDLRNVKNFQLSAYGKNGLHTIYKEKIDAGFKYSYIPKDVHYFCDPIIKNAIQKMGDFDFLDKIQSDNLVSAIDSKQCSPEQQEILKKQFKKSNKILTNCLDPKNENHPLIKDPGYEHAAKGMILSLESFVESASDSKSPVKLTCESNKNLKNRLGQLNEKSDPPTIAINFEKIDDDLKNKDDVNKDMLTSLNLSKVLSHELTHFYQKTDYQSLSDKICSLPKCEKNGDKNNKLDCISEEYYEYCKLPSTERKLTNDNNLCINESFTNEIMNVCYSTEDAVNLKAQRSSDLIFSCIKLKANSNELGLSKKEQGINSTSNSNRDSGNAPNVEVKNDILTGKSNNHEQQTAAQNAENKSNNTAAINTALNTGSTKVTDSDFKTVSSNTYAVLNGPTSNNPNPSYGKSYEVSANSNYGKAVMEAMSAFQKTESNVIPKLNAAVAATTQSAQATGNTLAKTNSNSSSITTTVGSSSSSRSPASDGATTTEKIASSSNSTTNNSNQNSELSGGAGNSGATAANSKISNGSSSAENVSGKNNLNPSNKMASTDTQTSKTPSAPSFNSGSANTINSNSGSAAAGSISQGTNSSNDPTNNSRSPASLPPAANNLGKSIQTLKAFSSVSGNQYQEVRSNYKNPLFEQELKKQNIRILVKNAQGQYLVLGSRDQQTQRVFLDDEKQKSIKILNDNRR